MKKIKKNNRKIEKICQTISQVLTPKPKHDKIRTQWTLDISLDSMLKLITQ
jgi:hypothetical protein